MARPAGGRWSLAPLLDDLILALQQAREKGDVVKTPDLAPLAESLKWAREAAVKTVRWEGGFTYPEFKQDYEFVALRHGHEYPFNEGRVVSNKGLDIAVQDYEQHFVEEQVPHSHALHSILKGRGSYFTGPLARYNLNFDLLTPLAKEAAREAGLGPVCLNPFQSIIVRAVELLYAVEEALAIIEAYEKPDRPAVPVAPRAVTGYAATEAPRGLLYHRYRIDENGVILEAKIVPPTSQNQPAIEHDLFHLVEQNLELDDEALRQLCEQAIRNYDPCISCATHFLDLRVDRS